MHKIFLKYQWLYLLTTLVFCSLNAQASDKTILVMGDSLSAGYGIDLNKGWVAQLQQHLAKRQWQVINASVSGETTTGGRKRLDKLLDEHKPAVVIVELGGNDGLRGQPLNIMRDNLQGMIDKIKTKGGRPVLVGMKIPPNYGTRYSQDFFDSYGKLAEKNNLILIPFLLEGVATQAELMQADRIHPNEAAQKKLLENALPWIEKAISK